MPQRRWERQEYGPGHTGGRKSRALTGRTEVALGQEGQFQSRPLVCGPIRRHLGSCFGTSSLLGSDVGLCFGSAFFEDLNGELKGHGYQTGTQWDLGSQHVRKRSWD